MSIQNVEVPVRRITGKITAESIPTIPPSPTRAKGRRPKVGTLIALGLGAIAIVALVLVLDDGLTDDIDRGTEARVSGPGSRGVAGPPPGDSHPGKKAAPSSEERGAGPRRRQPTNEVVPLSPARPDTAVGGGTTPAKTSGTVSGRNSNSTHGSASEGASYSARGTSGAGSMDVGAARDPLAAGGRGAGERGASDVRGAGASAAKGSDSGDLEEDPDVVRVARFTEGGAGVKGQVIDAATGKPLADVMVDAYFEHKIMGTTTDAEGAFRMMGLIPGKRVKVWMSDKTRNFVAEYLEVHPHAKGEATDVGVVRLLRGSEVTGNLSGWVGLFNGWQGHKNIITAVNPWSPADRADITTGDVILSVDGRSLEGMGPRATGFLLCGPVGTTTNIKIQMRDGSIRTVQLERVAR